MTSPTHKGAHHLGWRVGTPLVALASGVLFVVSAMSSQGTDLRPGRYTDLASLASEDAARLQRLQARVADLTDEVDTLGKQVNDTTVRKLQREADQLREPAGLTPRTGPGVTITLSDAPTSITDGVDTDKLQPYIVHQQDVQAVVNALWAGGASAVTIQGQRVVSTTGIKCSGSTIQLQGVPYPQPFVIEAVGDVPDLVTSIETDRWVSNYRDYADDPDYQLGWSLETSSHIEAPAYDGLRDFSYAKPLE
ncbi:DUF881 domain-containing protein [Nocardioides sp.]|uniref:DUF881 domain-containing protein n=1 Tax=Nocardioides sp. TaxID=35761 RepID=UPI0039E3F29B